MQLYGNDPNLTLMRFLRERRAQVTTVAPYVYGNAADDATVHGAARAHGDGEVDAIAFTSKLQIERLVTQHPAPLVRRALTRTKIAAVGPIVAEAIRAAGFEVASSPEHSWFMKPLVVALSEHVGRKKDKDLSGAAPMGIPFPVDSRACRRRPIHDALAHHQQGRLPEAEALYLQLLQTQPERRRRPALPRRAAHAARTARRGHRSSSSAH